MKKKLLMSVVVMFLLFVGVVGAASINGEFMGNPIVKIKSDGKVLPIEDTPAILYNNRTMVPIYMLRQLGVDVVWNAAEYSVDVRLPEQETSSTPTVNIDFIHNQLGTDNVALVEYSRIGNEFNQISYLFLFDTASEKSDVYDKAINYAYENGVTQVRIEDITGRAFFIKISNLKLYYEGKISADEFLNRFEYVPQMIGSGIGNDYDYEDAVAELGFQMNAILTTDARRLALELVEIRKTKRKDDYSVQDALLDLGIPSGSIPTLETLRQAVYLISIK